MTDEKRQARKIIGERIKRYREHLGMTQEDLAVKIGYTGNNPNITISKVENGIQGIPRDRLLDYARALGVDPIMLVRIDFKEDEINPKEDRLLNDFRQLTPEGQQYILDQLEFALLKFRKGDL